MAKSNMIIYCDAVADENGNSGWGCLIKTTDADVKNIIRHKQKDFQIAKFENIAVDNKNVSGIGRAASEQESSAGRGTLLAVEQALELTYLIQGGISKTLNVQISVPEQYVSLLQNKLRIWAEGGFVRPATHNKLARMIHGSFERTSLICGVSYTTNENNDTKFVQVLAEIHAERERLENEKQ